MSPICTSTAASLPLLYAAPSTHIVHLFACLLEELHESLGDAEPPILGRDGNGRHMAMFLLCLSTQYILGARIVALCLADDVAHDVAAGAALDVGQVGPLGQVGEVEAQAVRLCPVVQVDRVEAEQILCAEGRQLSHAERASESEGRE